jgi:hypothetical protein
MVAPAIIVDASRQSRNMWFRMILFVPFGICELFRLIRSLCDRLIAAGGDFARPDGLVQKKITITALLVALPRHCHPLATFRGAPQHRQRPIAMSLPHLAHPLIAGARGKGVERLCGSAQF